jgi:hypothetical protein
VDRLQFTYGQQAFRHASLVGYDDDSEIFSNKRCDRFGDSWKKLDLFPASYIFAFAGSAVYDAVTI